MISRRPPAPGRFLSVIVSALVLFAVPAADPALADKRAAAFVLDATTGKTLYSRSGLARRYPASLTKMMTLYLLFEEMEKGRVKPGTPMTVSRRAAAQQPSKLWLKPGSTITASDAISALVTKSANDVAVVVAEHLAGTESAFAARMTRRARALGMRGTQFRNASGLPNAAQYTTARDMALLGAALQARFPDDFANFKRRTFAHGGRTYRNFNRLLNASRGIDGIKTGFINASGFNIVVSRRHSGRKIVAVVMGGRSGKARNIRAASLVNSTFARAKRGRGYYPALMASIGKASPRTAVAVVNPPLPEPRPALAIAYASSPAVHVGTVATQEAAYGLIERTWPLLLDVVEHAEPLTQEVTRGGKTLFETRYVGFEDAENAQLACRMLKAENLSCHTQEH